MSTVHASIVKVNAVTGQGLPALVENSAAVGSVQTLTATVKSTLRAQEWTQTLGYTITVDNASGTFRLGETLEGNAGAGVARVIGVPGATSIIVGPLTSGALWVNNETLTGAESAATADVNVTVTPGRTYYGEMATAVQQLVWRIANMGTDNIYVAFGTDPLTTALYATSATTARKGIPAGTVAYFAVGHMGEFVIYDNA